MNCLLNLRIPIPY